MQNQLIERYVHEVLSVPVKVRPWLEQASLPYHLQDNYEYAAMRILHTHCILVMPRSRHESAAKIRRQFDVLAKHAPREDLLIYVAQDLASYERKRLIDQRVSFIVPGNQLYLPQLGVDLREYFRERRGETKDSFSPSTQAFLFTALLSKWKQTIHPSVLNEHLGYTPMTVTRSVRELEVSGLAEVISTGKERQIQFRGKPEDIWKKAQPWIRSPVRKEQWAIGNTVETKNAPFAGLSALSNMSMLAGPTQPVRAISAERWKQVRNHAIHKIPASEPGATCWQIWSYEPKLVPYMDEVDPFSLIASLRDNPDERVGEALDELARKLPW